MDFALDFAHLETAICLQDIDTAAAGPDVSFEWPTCRHPIHLQCAIQHVSHQGRPACPTCRQPWTREGGVAMEQARSMHQVPWMVPETPYDTRTHHVEAPPAPDHVIPLCCPRLVLVDHEHPEHDTSWRELPARHMEWAPTFDQTTQQWQPEWVCLRCNNTLTPEDRAMQHTEPAPHCPTHGPRRLAIDLRQNERGWVCSRGYPPHILPCEPTQIPNAPPAIHHQQQQEQPNRTHTGQWYSQGPPNQHQVVPYANSWFFVPLLLAGGNRLQAQTEQQWRAHPHAGHEWQTLVDALRTAPPIPWRDLHNTLATLQQMAADSGHQLPAAERANLEQLAAARSFEPAGSQVHLPWVLNVVAYPTGYVPATAQEALLQHYLGDRQASSAASLADRWRQPQHTTSDHFTRPTTTTAIPNQDAPNRDSSETDTSESPGDTTSSTSTASTSSTSTSHAATPSPPQRTSTAPRPAPQTRPEQPGADDQTHHQRHRAAFQSLDEIDLQETLMKKFIGFQSPPTFLKGRMRQAMQFALEAILQATTADQTLRSWKLWLLLPRMLLHRPPGIRTISKPDWRLRIAQFQEGEWTTLLRQAAAANPQRANISTDPHQTSPETPDSEQRTRRARQLVHQGELSAARQALTAGPLAPSTDATLRELRDPARRPPHPYQEFPQHLTEFHPPAPPNLPPTQLLTNLRKARKGAAPGPSGFTAEILRLVLDDEVTSQHFVAVATRLAKADIPHQVSQAIGLGRVVALQKPNGRVRGIVIGDLLRRLVSWCLAQTYASHFHAACMPHQFALSTRAGTEAIVHALTSATEAHPNHTILSVDGIGAYDTISANQHARRLTGSSRCQQLPPLCTPVLRTAIHICLARHQWPTPRNHTSRRRRTRRSIDAGSIFLRTKRSLGSCPNQPRRRRRPLRLPWRRLRRQLPPPSAGHLRPIGTTPWSPHQHPA